LFSFQTHWTSSQENASYCPATWDGWSCHAATPADKVTSFDCPDFIHTQSSLMTGRAIHTCRQDATWGVHPGTGREWTDYSSCSSQDDSLFVANAGAFCASVICLLPSVAIFFSYRQLRVHRITLHKHLFMSLILTGIFSMAWDLGVITKTEVTNSNGVVCRVLYVAKLYCVMTNYSWMLCESFFLHHILVTAFAEIKSLKVYYAFGWGFPILPTSLYTFFKLR
jgi:hypothetical protein